MTICGIADNVAFTPALARVNFTRAGPRRKQSREAAGGKLPNILFGRR